MAVNKRERGADNVETNFEAQLTPPEETKAETLSQKQKDDGTLQVNTGDLKIPQELAEEEETKTAGWQSVDPAVMVILCFSLIFIAVIAFVIWNGWEPPPSQ